jgi:hypothetical protein
MIQGWNNDDYLILFDEQNEAVKMAERYTVTSSLPGYALIGLKSWDDFILRDAKNQHFTIPIVPLDLQYLQIFNFDLNSSKLLVDQRFTDKIRWFIKPIAFGGDPNAETNTSWITINQHIEAVKWWNQLYRDVKLKKPSV